uniref:Uncharacterized protein n=1 Tax=Arundo donax TaxID=35708 RepID=A0A0A9H3L4_ARUDO
MKAFCPRYLMHVDSFCMYSLHAGGDGICLSVHSRCSSQQYIALLLLCLCSGFLLHGLTLVLVWSCMDSNIGCLCLQRVRCKFYCRLCSVLVPTGPNSSSLRSVDDTFCFSSAMSVFQCVSVLISQ